MLACDASATPLGAEGVREGARREVSWQQYGASGGHHERCTCAQHASCPALAGGEEFARDYRVRNFDEAELKLEWMLDSSRFVSAIRDSSVL